MTNPNPKPLYIGFVGKKQSGKDTVADMFADQLAIRGYCVSKIPFALALKQEVAELTGGSFATIEINKTDPRLRFILQQFGTEYYRNSVDKDHWINQWLNTVSKQTTGLKPGAKAAILIPDVRFQNEAGMLHSLGGKLYRIRRNLMSDDTHASEVELEQIGCDSVIWNDRTLFSLKEEVNLAIQQLKL